MQLSKAAKLLVTLFIVLGVVAYLLDTSYPGDLPSTFIAGPAQAAVSSTASAGHHTLISRLVNGK